jgi:hypothetical protein
MGRVRHERKSTRLDGKLSEACAWMCPVCGARFRVRHLPIVCTCGYVQYEHPPGLGDRTAAALARVGITKQRYTRAKRAVGLKGDCGCAKRQRRLNELARTNTNSDGV